MSDHHNSDTTEHVPHILPLKVYFGVAGALLVLTVVTVLTAEYVEIGSFNIVLAMAIASVKASLVCAYFMHLKYDKGFNRLAFFSGLLFLSFFFIFTLSDTLTRKDEEKPEKGELIEALDGYKANGEEIGESHH